MFNLPMHFDRPPQTNPAGLRDRAGRDEQGVEAMPLARFEPTNLLVADADYFSTGPDPSARRSRPRGRCNEQNRGRDYGGE